MNIDTARLVLQAAIRSAGELQQLLPMLKERCPPEEYKIYLKAIATVLAEVSLKVTNRVVAEHPELEAEVEASIARNGRYA